MNPIKESDCALSVCPFMCYQKYMTTVLLIKSYVMGPKGSQEPSSPPHELEGRVRSALNF